MNNYGIITPQFIKQNNGIFLARRVNPPAVISCSDTLNGGGLHLVYDTTDIGKDYKRSVTGLDSRDTRIYNNYYKNNGRINAILAQTVYVNDTKYDENILRRNRPYGVQLKRNNEIIFSTNDRYVKIIDQIFVSDLLNFAPVSINYKFEYVRKIGVALPITTYGDMSDSGYITYFFITFKVVDYKLFIKVGNNLAPETISRAPYQIFEKQVREIAGLASPCLIVDLSEVV